GNKVPTDAPKDNHGRGAAFSPTDLLGAALLSCAVTTIAIKAGIPAAKGRVIKDMHPAPRRVGKLTVEIELPASIVDRAHVENIGRTCPVALSLSKDVIVDMTFRYG